MMKEPRVITNDFLHNDHDSFQFLISNDTIKV